MPFKSKAQQRFMFATKPRTAKRWAAETKDIKKLPEKLPEKDAAMTKQAKGMFFEKSARSNSGHFFRDAKGRDDATFYQKTAMETEKASVGASGAPMGGFGSKGEGIGEQTAGAGAGMYGSGKGLDEKKGKETEAQRLEKLLAKVSDKKDKDEKNASAAPSDWDAGEGLPTGFHRPTDTQPEDLEPGGERFHETDPSGPEFGAGVSMSNGLVEGGAMRVRQGSGAVKHASVTPRFMGTSYGIDKQAMKITDRSTWERSGDQAKKTGKRVLRQAGETAGKALDKASKSPVALGIGALLAARFGMRGVKGLSRGAMRMAGRKAPKSGISRAIGSVKKLMS